MKKGNLQSLAIPEAKWQEVSVDFVTDLPAASEGEDSIMTVVDRATKMVHLIPCTEDHNSRRGCKTLLAASGQTSWSSLGNPHRSGCPVYR